jgi:hypothetical protein
VAGHDGRPAASGSPPLTDSPPPRTNWSLRASPTGAVNAPPP